MVEQADPASTSVPPSSGEGRPNETAASMRYGHRCRAVVGVALRAFLDLIEASAVEGQVALDEIHRIGKAVADAEGALLAFYDRHSAGCATLIELAQIEHKRTDFFGRAITEPFFALLDDPTSGVRRTNLPHYFAAVRMILGNEIYAEFKEQCAVIANEIRAGARTVPWPQFHADARTHVIVEDTLVAIARSFKRFELRKEWFMIVMNNDPRTVSLGSSMFVAKSSDEMLQDAFSEPSFVKMFKALFAGMRPNDFTAARRSAFIDRYGEKPEGLFGQLLVELEKMNQRSNRSSPVRRNIVAGKPKGGKKTAKKT